MGQIQIKVVRKMKNQAKSGVIYITGLAGAGKTTFASELYKHLKQKHSNVILLDGDVFRNIFGESGFKRDERLMVAYKINALAGFLEQNGLLVIVATMSLFDEIYTLNRANFKNYFEVFVKCDFDELVRRDKKGLYSGALSGVIKNVVGVDIAYDEPKAHFVLENHHATNLDEKLDNLFTKIDEFIDNAKEKEKIDDKNYWENYYQARLNTKEQEQSNFASFCVDNYFDKDSRLIELGCGNGRDSVYFAKNGINVLGIDQCENVIEFLNKKHKSENLVFQSGDFTDLPNADSKFDAIYSRFTLHSINSKQQDRLFGWINANLKTSGILAIECRGYKNSLYRLGVMVENDAFIYENHYRRFVKFEDLLGLLSKDYEILFAKEDKGFAPFRDEDDFFVRVVGRKKI
ncbi:adenylyl-sulfate kinase [Helicobacter sp. 23-1048]